MSDKSRRKLLKSIAAGSGAIVAGKSLPESWTKPVVDSVILPVHAETSPPVGEATTYSESLTQNTTFNAAGGPLTFNFDVTGFTPTGPGTISVEVFGDFGNYAAENVTVQVDGTDIIVLFDVLISGPDCIIQTDSLTIDFISLQAAAADNNVAITLVPSSDVGDFCAAGDQIVGLTFPATV
jgi:hypothetical protein